MRLVPSETKVNKKYIFQCKIETAWTTAFKWLEKKDLLQKIGSVLLAVVFHVIPIH